MSFLNKSIIKDATSKGDQSEVLVNADVEASVPVTNESSNDAGAENRPAYHIHPDSCTFCKKCLKVCKAGAIHQKSEYEKFMVLDFWKCTGCGACEGICFSIIREEDDADAGVDYPAQPVEAEVGSSEVVSSLVVHKESVSEKELPLDVRQAYVQGCAYAALVDDGKIDDEERKAIAEIAQRFHISDEMLKDCISMLEELPVDDRKEFTDEIVGTIKQGGKGVDFLLDFEKILTVKGVAKPEGYRVLDDWGKKITGEEDWREAVRKGLDASGGSQLKWFWRSLMAVRSGNEQSRRYIAHESHRRFWAVVNFLPDHFRKYWRWEAPPLAAAIVFLLAYLIMGWRAAFLLPPVGLLAWGAIFLLNDNQEGKRYCVWAGYAALGEVGLVILCYVFSLAGRFFKWQGLWAIPLILAIIGMSASTAEEKKGHKIDSALFGTIGGMCFFIWLIAMLVKGCS